MLRSSLCSGTTTEITAQYASAMARLLTVDEARDGDPRARRGRCRSETVPLADAAGRVLAETATSAVDLPPFPSSAMDGFAVRAADTPGRLAVVARIAAGQSGAACACRR